MCINILLTLLIYIFKVRNRLERRFFDKDRSKYSFTLNKNGENGEQISRLMDLNCYLLTNKQV